MNKYITNMKRSVGGKLVVIVLACDDYFIVYMS